MTAEPLPPRRNVEVLAAVIAAAFGIWIIRTGIQTAADTQTYSRWADLLIGHGFDIPAYLRDQNFVVPPILYLLWVLLVATLKSTFGAGWMTAVVALNWVAFSAGVRSTLLSVRSVTRSNASLLVAAMLFPAAGDLLIFVPFVLSDLIFWGLSTVTLALGLDVATDHRTATRQVLIATVLVAVALAFRPTALPLLGFWLMALGARLSGDLLAHHGTKFLTAVAVLLLAAVAAHAYVLYQPSAWPFGKLPGMLALLAQESRDGVLVYAPGANLHVAPAADWLGFVRLTMQKWMYFFTPWLPHYSRFHAAINLTFFIPAFALSAAAIANIHRLWPPQQVAVCLLTAYALCLSVFHAMMQIDYDHRYRLPLLPALIMLAALGLETLRRPEMRASRRRTQ